METELYFTDGLLVFMGIALVLNSVLFAARQGPALRRATLGLRHLMRMGDDDFYCFFHKNALTGGRAR